MEVDFEKWLSAALLPEAFLSFEKFAAMQHGAAWTDVAAKAKRLVQEGKVTILRNSPTHVMAHVVGDGTDNGGTPDEHDVEISRTNPNSQMIEQWNCDCAWAQYSFDRTRKWKKFEGRPCLVPGSRVTMADGSYKDIEDVQVGDEVITHDGTGVVTRTMVTPHDGPIYSIYRTGYPDPIRLTGNHEIWAISLPSKVRKSAEISEQQGQSFKISDPKFLDHGPEWIDAVNLRKHDWIASTWVSEESVVPMNGVATVLGYFLAEGNTAQPNKDGRHLQAQWTFHLDEKNLADDLEVGLRKMGFKGRVLRYERYDTNSLDVRINSLEIATELERLAGRYARTKQLAPEVMRWNCSALEEFLRTYHAGDGTIKKDGRYTFYTSSAHLARQIFDLLVKCGYVPSWTHEQNNGGPQNRERKTSIERIQYVPNSRQFNGRRRFEDHYLSKVTRVDVDHYVGPVYNLSVNGQESYVAEGVTNHNCSHVLATYWKAKSTPLDITDQDEGYQVPRGQKRGPAGPGQEGLPGMPPMGPPLDTEQREFEPEPEEEEGEETPETPGGAPPEQGPAPAPAPQSLPSTQDLTVPKQPSSPFGTPKQPPVPQHEQLQLFDITAPPGMQPTPSASPVSIPGGRPPTPGNPVQFPGTFSHFIPVLTLKTSRFIVASDALTDYFETQRAAHLPITVALTSIVALERQGGKIPIPGAQPYGTSSEGIPLYRVMELGWNPATGERENSDVNALQGAPAQEGTYTDVSPGRRAEVIDYDPALKMAYITVSLNYPEGGDVRLHPHQLSGWVDYKDIRPVQGARPPDRRRRR